MSTEFWTVVGAIAAILALVVAIVIGVATFRRQFPKRELQWTVEKFPLLNSEVFAHAHSGLKVSLDGREVKDPHVVIVRVSSRSRVDIASAAFDAGSAIQFKSSRPIVTTAWSATSDKSIAIEPDESDRTISGFRVPPQLIRRGSTGVLAGIASGEPAITVTRKALIDIDVKQVSPASGTTWRAWTGQLAAAALATAAAGFLTGLLQNGLP